MERDTEYNVTVGLEDSEYLYKEVKLKFTTPNVESVGDFHLIQWMIGNATDGGTIELLRSYEFMPVENFPALTLPDDWCVNITKPITINGNGFSISGEGFTRIFNITANNVTLTNIQFINGNSSGKYNDAVAHNHAGTVMTCGDGVNKGGAIYWSGVNGTVENSTFQDNYAEVGGGLYIAESALNSTIARCAFIENTADTFGGAIDCNAPKMNLTNTVFESNYADTGAALCREKTATGGFGINNTFIKNQAKTNGSALAWMEARNIFINNYTFIDNTAGYSGGAIYVGKDSTNCTVAYSYFKGNNITSVDNGHGGAIAGFNSNNANISDCYFKFNTVGIRISPQGIAYGEGGAIYWQNSTNLRVSNSEFESNEAHLSGGSISADGCNDSVIYNILTHDETAFRNGGSVSWINSNNVTIEKARFNDSGANYRGGTIYLANINATVKHSLVNYTWASWGRGGGIYVDGNVTINNVTFNDTHGDEDNATAVYFNSGVSTIVDSKFTNSFNSIGIAKGANVTLTRNNLTASDPNRDTVKYLEKNTTEAVRMVKYAVWNDGNLWLDKNNFDYVIFNNGIIWTKTTTKLLNNETHNVSWNEYFTFWANITDDNLNTIISVRSLNTSNQVYQDVAHSFILPYNQITLQCSYQGSFKLKPYDENLKQNDIYNGTLNVKMPVSMEINSVDIGNGGIQITATLTPTVKSNYTIKDQFMFFEIDGSPYNLEGLKIINIDEKYEKPFTTWTKANVTFELNDLTSGTHTITGNYKGDIVHLNVTKQSPATVNARDAWIKIVIENINYGESTNAVITTNSNGTVRLNFHGKNKIIDVAMHKDATGNYTATVPITLENYTTTGTHDAGVVVEANEYFGANTNITSFEVYKLNTTVTATLKNYIEVGEKQVIEVTVNDNYAGLNASGFANITINGETYFKKLDANGKATFNIYELPQGNYPNYKVEYLGDDYFNGNSTLVSFAVGQTDDYNITVLVDNITYGQNATIYISLPTSVTQNLTVFVNNTKIENVVVNNGMAKVVAPNLKAGTYVVNVTYPGDDVYAAKDKNGTMFKVTASDDWNLNLAVEAHQYGQNTIFTVTVPKNIATKLVNLTIDGKYNSVTINDNGIGTLELNNLSGGFHTAIANYTGDANYSTKTNSTSFYVELAPSQVNLTQNGKTVEAKVTEIATGTVTFYVNGKNETKYVDVAGIAKWEDVLEIGNNTVVAVYNGDKNFTVSQNSTSDFTIPKYDNAKVNVTATNVTYGNASVITVEVPAAQTGYVNIVINGTDINVTLPLNARGIAKFNVTGLNVGIYRVNVTYLGDRLYNAKENFTLFNITKANLTAEVVVQNATVRGNVSFVVDVNSDFSGKVNITKDGVSYFDDDYRSLIVIGKLPAGIYDANMTFYGDDNYNNKTVPVRFEVSKVDPEIIVVIDDVTYPGAATARIQVNDNGNGDIRLVVDDKDITLPITNGALDINIEGLSGGAKNATVTFTSTDNYYNDGEVKVKFEVRKAPSQVNITQNGKTVEVKVTKNATGTVTFYVNGKNENIRLIVPEDATGNVTVVIDGDEFNFNLQNGALGAAYAQGEKYSVAISRGKGELVISGLPKGEYVVSVRYNGDNKYMPSVNSTIFTVSKQDTPMKVIDLGNGTVKVVLPDDATGNVTITDGNNTYTAEVINGIAVVDLNNTSPGKHDIEVKYSGDNDHSSNSTRFTVDVPKYESPISVEASDINVGETEIVTVTVPDKATGKVTIEINGKEYTEVVENCKAIFYVGGLAFGEKTVAVKYSGDDNYTTGQFTVSKVPSTVKPKSSDITVGKDEVISVVVPEDATGRVLVDIGGVGYYGNVVNGKAKVVIPELPSGKYTAKVTYEGDDKYLPSTNTTSFKVFKAKAPISAGADDILEGDDAIVVVKVPKDATGTVTISIDGKTYTSNVRNGQAVFTVPGLTRGDYDIDASYSGDRKYDANDTITDLEVLFNETPDHHGGINAKAGISISQYATGNPVILVLLVLLAIGSTQIRRFKK